MANALAFLFGRDKARVADLGHIRRTSVCSRRNWFPDVLQCWNRTSRSAPSIVPGRFNLDSYLSDGHEPSDNEGIRVGYACVG